MRASAVQSNINPSLKQLFQGLYWSVVRSHDTFYFAKIGLDDGDKITVSLTSHRKSQFLGELDLLLQNLSLTDRFRLIVLRPGIIQSTFPDTDNVLAFQLCVNEFLQLAVESWSAEWYWPSQSVLQIVDFAWVGPTPTTQRTAVFTVEFVAQF